ncbi:hypothetical protein CF319_g5028 [Tilletia indica]|uniref:Uncharacterized protein n=1 Tax=Tilletia indica TaxID=43049 RepID=A0A177TDI2_9BASI|nr:hypothetical protein CF319_g5028 [Tilletia indica]KAE8250752.1 hypothetical protein A4X13_0g4420 [Tilletia indica]
MLANQALNNPFPLPPVPINIDFTREAHTMYVPSEAIPQRDPGTTDPKVLRPFIQCALRLAGIDSKFRTVFPDNTTDMFDGICDGHVPIVRSLSTPWIPKLGGAPTDHKHYWTHHLGQTWPASADILIQSQRFDKAQPIGAATYKIDIRIPGHNVGRKSGQPSFSAWMASACMLARICTPNPALRVLHLRMSVQEDLIRMVSSVLRHGHRLTEVVIMGDTPVEMRGQIRPILNFGDAYPEDGSNPAELHTFVFRVPALRVRCPGGFLRALRKAHTCCIAVQNIVTQKRTWEWTLDLVKAAPSLKALELSEALPWDPVEEYNMRPLQNKHTTIRLNDLLHLTLDLHQVDARFLSKLQAPNLKFIRISSRAVLSDEGFCPLNHFPSLSYANIWCPGPTTCRFQAIGLGKHQFFHNLTDDKYFLDNYDQEVMVHIKKFNADVERFYSNIHHPHLHNDADYPMQDGSSAELADVEQSD